MVSMIKSKSSCLFSLLLKSLIIIYFILFIKMIICLFQVPFARDIYGLILPNFGVGFAIGKITTCTDSTYECVQTLIM